MFNLTKYISCLCLLICINVYGKNIVVLTSLPASQAEATEDLNRIVTKKLSNFTDYKLILINKADQDDLYKSLNDPETIALFWVSHGAFKTVGSDRSLIKASSLLLDHNNDNVAEIFKSVHPNIQFLGVIGCNSSQILDKHLKLRPHLGSYTPTKKVVATWAMRKSIRKFKRHYRKTKYQFIEKDIVGNGYKVRITRLTQLDSKSLKIFAGKHLLGVLPKVKAGVFQDKLFYIPEKHTGKSSLKIIAKSGQSAFDESDNFGVISIENESQSFWKLFAKRDGTPFGTNERIFLFKGNRSDLSSPINYIIFNTSKY